MTPDISSWAGLHSARPRLGGSNAQERTLKTAFLRSQRRSKRVWASWAVRSTPTDTPTLHTVNHGQTTSLSAKGLAHDSPHFESRFQHDASH